MSYKDELRSPLSKLLRAGLMVLIIAVPTTWLTWNIILTDTLQCTVCMEYRGKSQCRTATGPDAEQCIRTATDNACAFLSSGMTDSMACGRTRPVSVDVESDTAQSSIESAPSSTDN